MPQDHPSHFNWGYVALNSGYWSLIEGRRTSRPILEGARVPRHRAALAENAPGGVLGFPGFPVWGFWVYDAGMGPHPALVEL